MTIKWYKTKIVKHCKNCHKTAPHKVSLNHKTNEIKLICEDCGYLNENNIYDATKVKFCPRCTKIKDRGMFHKNKATMKSGDGLQAYCMECTKAYQREIRKKRKEREAGQHNLHKGDSQHPSSIMGVQGILHSMQEEAERKTKSQRGVDKILVKITDLENRLDKILEYPVTESNLQEIAHLAIGIRYLNLAREALE